MVDYHQWLPVGYFDCNGLHLGCLALIFIPMANEFTAKKLGEVMAFARVGEEIFERGRSALETIFSKHGVNQILHDISTHLVSIETLSQELGTEEITAQKCEKTKEKLEKMMELYVGDEWDNPTELLEWLGFFEGAALIHWKLVQGAGDALQHVDTKKLSTAAIAFHQKLLTDVGDHIHNAGSKKALA